MDSNLAKIETVSFFDERLICPVINGEPFVIVNQVIELIGLFPQRAMLDLRNNPRLSKWTALISIKREQNDKNSHPIRDVNFEKTGQKNVNSTTQDKTDVPVWVCQFEKNGEKSQFFVQIDTQIEGFFENLKGYSYAVLPVRKFAAWIYGISPERVKPEIRPNLEKYQDFCDEILFEYFFGTLAKRKNLLGEKVQLKARIKELEQELENDDRFKELVNLRAEEMRMGKTLKDLDRDELRHQTSLLLE